VIKQTTETTRKNHRGLIRKKRDGFKKRSGYLDRRIGEVPRQEEPFSRGSVGGQKKRVGYRTEETKG